MQFLMDDECAGSVVCYAREIIQMFECDIHMFEYDMIRIAMNLTTCM